MNTEMNRRMADADEIPEMNGTIKKLVELIAAPLDNPEQQSLVIRESVKLQLHTYVLQKQLLIAVNKLLEERSRIITKLIDKGLTPLLFMMLVAVLALIFKDYIPTP